jgi:hypothetical protein
MSMDTVSRSVEPPRRRGTSLLGLLAAALGCGAAVGVAGAVGAALQDAPPPPPPPQVTVSAPAVTVAAPPIVVAPVREPTPAPEPEPATPPRPRASTPFINADCFAPRDDVPLDRACYWDEGLPAVSADGTRVAMMHSVGPGQADHASLYLRVLDVRTSRVVRDVLIHTQEEDYEMDEVEAAAPTARARVKRRTAAAQRLLDAGGYRTLDPLGHVDWSLEQNDLDRSVVHAEIAEDLVRAIDPATNRVLWQHRFSVPRPRGGDPDDECAGFGFHGSSVWWDPGTRVVLVTQDRKRGV